MTTAIWVTLIICLTLIILGSMVLFLALYFDDRPKRSRPLAIVQNFEREENQA